MGVYKKNIEFSNHLRFARILPDLSVSDKKGPQGHKKRMEEMKMKFSVLKDILTPPPEYDRGIVLSRLRCSITGGLYEC